MQTEIHTAEPPVPDPSASEVELAIDKLKGHKSPGIDQIPVELIKVVGRTLCLEIHKLITSIWEKEKLPEEWKESIIVPIHKKGDKTDCSMRHVQNTKSTQVSELRISHITIAFRGGA